VSTFTTNSIEKKKVIDLLKDIIDSTTDKYLLFFLFFFLTLYRKSYLLFCDCLKLAWSITIGENIMVGLYIIIIVQYCVEFWFRKHWIIEHSTHYRLPTTSFHLWAWGWTISIYYIEHLFTSIFYKKVANPMNMIFD
jgi:hypothetical protein